MADGVSGRPAALPAERGGTSLWLKLVYGVGSMAFGIKDNGFQTILLIFYNQVVGMNPLLVGVALMLAIGVDAIMDPIVGEFSDTLRTRWGRRHPLMYASAIPLGLSYLLLWNPPQHASQGLLFVYLVVVSVIIRTFISLYEAPSQALAAELTTGYAERTSLLGFRSVFQWFGGLLMFALAFQVFLKPDATHPVGQLNPVGYSHYGLMAAILMATAILISTAGTHSRIKYLAQPPERRRTLGEIASEVVATLSNRSYLSLLGSNLFAATAVGLSLSMNLYFYTYVWNLTGSQIAIFALVSMVSAALGSFLARLASTRDKRLATVVLFLTGLIISSSPLALRQISLFLPNGSAALFPTLLVFSLISLSMMIAGGILAASMVADVVEDSQLKTGRRSEGLFFGGMTFVQKATSGLGIFLSSTILALVHFPAKATPGSANGVHVEPAVISHLVWLYLPTTLSLFVISMLWLSGYRITRASHEASLQQLATAAAEGRAVIPEA